MRLQNGSSSAGCYCCLHLALSGYSFRLSKPFISKLHMKFRNFDRKMLPRSGLKRKNYADDSFAEIVTAFQEIPYDTPYRYDSNQTPRVVSASVASTG